MYLFFWITLVSEGNLNTIFYPQDATLIDATQDATLINAKNEKKAQMFNKKS